MMVRSIASTIASLAILATGASIVSAQVLKLEEVTSLSGAGAQIKPNMISISDHRSNELVDPATGLIKFEDWARANPLQKQYLSLYSSYTEPKISVTVDGTDKSFIDKLSMYVVEARFVVPRSFSAEDLARYASLPFLEKMDPAIKHRTINAADVIPASNSEYAFNKNPARAWCESQTQTICIQSRYQLEGKLPVGIQLANQLVEGKKHVDYLEFQSELRVVPQQDIKQDEIKKLTELDAPVIGVLEQNIFYVNQVMEFGKLYAVLQQHPSDKAKTIVTTYMALAIKNRTLDRKRQFEKVPVLRNLVPSQVLMGNSSFNTGRSLSAGLPSYTRNQIQAVAGLLTRD
jgi:hypothetical protein